MSKQVQDPGGMERAGRVDCEFLYGSRGRYGQGVKTESHSHPFWQLEIVLAGAEAAIVEGRRFALGAGGVLLIRPGTPHRFVFEHETRLISFKFKASAAEGGWAARRLPAGPEAEVLARALAELLPEAGEPAARTKLALNGLLAAVLRLGLWAGPAERDDDRGVSTTEFVERVRDLVAAKEGLPVTIRGLAREMGCSVAHLSRQFRRSQGEALKAYLDRERARAAARLLTYAELRIGEIAARLAFPDPYTFSRFCKRTLGACPRAYRRAALRGP
ncbi:MAG: helix-turn-helix transcriptional regulator [Kiritimatiellae bacterium]|nr:helix-turn-helix transcriptional regulator [Kiritimatiellia bacterium]